MLSADVCLADGRVVPLMHEDLGCQCGMWVSRLTLDGKSFTSGVSPGVSALEREASDRAALELHGVTDRAFDAWLDVAIERHIAQIRALTRRRA